MIIYTLFETDQLQTNSSRIFLGNFSSEEKAISAFKKNDKFSSDTAMTLIETTLDEYEEQ